VKPPCIADVLALTGDSSDNIPGVDGIGQKTAAALITQFESIEELLAHPERIASEKTREKILAQRQRILDNRSMVGLDLDLILPQPIDSLTIAPRYPELIEEIRRCEFRTLLAEIEKEAASVAPVVPVAKSAPKAEQAELF
jgi:DNA polymerase-1